MVTIGTLAGTATKDTDYTVTTALASITIDANSKSGTGTLTITPTDDTVVEGDETIIVSGTTTVTGLSVSDAIITLTDDDKSTTTVPGDTDSAELSITGPTSSVAEGSDATFTVTLSKQVDAAVTVAWSAPLAADAAEAADLSATSGTVTFAANSSAGATKSITITATDDALSETAESFTVTLGTITSTLASQISLKNGSSSAQATIAESDPITVTLSGPTTVDEGDTTTAYTVSLSPSGVTPTADLTVSYNTANGTATAGSDYTAKSGTLTFTNAAAGSQTFTVQTTADTIDEGTGETFTVAISSPSGGGGATPTLGTSSVSTTITDDDDAPTGITLSASPNTLGEDDSATSVTVTATLAGGTTRTSATVVTIGTLEGTATKDTDYTVTSLASITIPANTASGTGTLTITPTDDAVVEGDETITIPGTTTVGLTVTSATVTLTDDNKTTTTPADDKDSADLSISGPASSADEGSNAVFTVTLSKQVDAEVQVAWSAPLTADAAEGADLGTTSGTVTFAANSAAGATQNITITATDDKLSETAEGFTMTLGTITSTLSSQVSLKDGAKTATATISESDPITITISGPTSVDEGDATSSYTVSLSPSGVTPTADLTVSYATSNGTAIAGSDYTAATGTLTFTTTATGSQTFTVQTTEDEIDEGTGETFTVTISSPSGGGGPAPSLGTSKSITTTITDDDDAPTGIALSASPNTLGEDDSATSVTVTATLNGGTTRAEATVVTIGALAGTATKDTDYAATALGNITIAPNSSTGTASFTVTPTDDSVVEGDETIIVSGTTTISLDVNDAIITLTDDNKTTTPANDKDSATLSISGPSANVSEGNNAVFTVTLSKQVAAEVQVAWSAPLGTDAADGADLSATSGTVTFAANSAAGATETITITAADDMLSEGAESFTVTLGTITSGLSSQVSLKDGAKSATATISASDPITVSITGPETVIEGETTTAYTVSLSPSGVTPTANLTVNYATADGTATAGSDYTAASGTLTFTSTAADAQTFTVQTTDDIRAETTETFTVAISNASGGGGSTSLGTWSVTTTIDSNDSTSDPPENRPEVIAKIDIRLSVDPDSVNENAGAQSFTVTATRSSGVLSQDTVIGLTLGGTAGDSDYTAPASASVTIKAGQSSGTGTLALTLIDDTVVEGDETIIVDGSSGDLTIGSALITIHDDDATYLSIAGPTTAEVSEGGSASFTVTLSETVAADVTVAWSAIVAGDTAVATDLDSTSRSGSVTFDAGSSAGATETITVTVTDDNLSEGTETFSVELGAVTGDGADGVYVKSTAASATATIAASDPITVSISGPSSVDEGDTTSDYTVSLSPSGVTPTSDLTVSYGTSDGTATAGTDYTAKSGTLTFTNAAAGSQTFTVQTTEDIRSERYETFTVSISSPSGGGGPAPTLGTSSVTTTIPNDDPRSDPPDSNRPGAMGDVDVWLTVAPNSVNEDSGETSFTVTANHYAGTPPATATMISLTLAGTAGESDYTAPATASVTIPGGVNSGSTTLTLTLIDDQLVEGDETIIVGGKSGSLDIASALITVHDDDSTYLSITGPTNVSEGANASFTVTLDKAVTADVTVAWSAIVDTDTAVAADLGATTSGSVTFDANSAAKATQIITVPVTDDALSEGSETFSVALGADTGDQADIVWVRSTAASATATIAESDPITVNLTGPTSVNEGATTADYTVSLSPSGVTPTADLTVTYATANGTATAGSDYDAQTGVLTFTSAAAGDKTFTVQTTEDILAENSEDFIVTISSPAGGGGPAPSLSTASISTTIRDNDGEILSPSLELEADIRLTVSPTSVTEKNGDESFTVTAEHIDATDTRTVDIEIALALGGTATSSDYTAPASASVTISANQPSGSATLTLTLIDDELIEGDETIIVGGSSGDLAIASALITIHDNDSTYLSITGPTTEISEGGNASFTVTLDKAVTADVTVAWSAIVDTDTAVAADLGATTSGSVTFDANSAAGATKTITVAVTDDALSEGTETFSVELGDVTGDGANGVYVKSTADSATATIAESDPITVNLTGPTSVEEGATTTDYTVSLSPSGVTPTEDLTVTYATADGTAKSGSDYTAKTVVLTFASTAAGRRPSRCRPPRTTWTRVRARALPSPSPTPRAAVAAQAWARRPSPPPSRTTTSRPVSDSA